MTDIHISHKINSLVIKSISYIRVYVKLKNVFIEKIQHIKFSVVGQFEILTLLLCLSGYAMLKHGQKENKKAILRY